MSLPQEKTSRIIVCIFLFSFFVSIHSASAAKLSITTINSSGPYSVGQLFSVGVFVSTESGEAMNAVSGILSFPPEIIQLVSVDKAGGIIDFWIGDQSFSNGEGKAHFEGGRYNPGFAGTNGKVIAFLFKAKTKGTANITFTEASVLANDGAGTEILTNTGTATVVVNTGPAVAPTVNALPSIDVRSSTHPNQDSWYDSKRVELSWELPQNITALRTIVDHSPNTTPTNTSSKLSTNTELSLEDGVWYFHIQGKDLTTWGPVTHYKIQIDSERRQPPTFDDFSRTLVEGDAFLVSGRTYPDSEVSLFLQDSSGNTGVETTRSDNEGRFQLVWGKRLKGDTYSLSAEVKDVKGISSPRSPDLTIKVHLGALERVGWPILNYFTIGLVALALIFALVMWTWYLIHHFGKFKKRVRANIKKTDQHVHARFKKLEDMVLEHALMLKRAKSRRDLTVQEEKIFLSLGKLLEDAETQIEKDVDDIAK